MAVNKEKTKVLQVSFPRDRYSDLQELARKEGYSVSGFIKKEILDRMKKEA